jgi:hypothetical protein
MKKKVKIIGIAACVMIIFAWQAILLPISYETVSADMISIDDMSIVKNADSAMNISDVSVARFGAESEDLDGILSRNNVVQARALNGRYTNQELSYNRHIIISNANLSSMTATVSLISVPVFLFYRRIGGANPNDTWVDGGSTSSVGEYGNIITEDNIRAVIVRASAQSADLNFLVSGRTVQLQFAMRVIGGRTEEMIAVAMIPGLYTKG